MWLDIELAVPHEGGQHDEHWAELLADDEAARGFAGAALDEVAREKGAPPQHHSQRRWLATCTAMPEPVQQAMMRKKADCSVRLFCVWLSPLSLCCWA